ncbi:MAG: hypothetical protein QGG48_13840, partial [Desulfatiglandales bacterium]|nr:hypothetical protein [Desulfatiglandales bacterium]
KQRGRSILKINFIILRTHPSRDGSFYCDTSFSFLNAEPLNTHITRGVEAMINVDSKSKQFF